MCAWLGSKALGSGALARGMLIRRPLVRKVLARERGAGQRNNGRNWNRTWSRGLDSETLGMKPAGFARRRRKLSKSKFRITTGVRQVLFK